MELSSEVKNLIKTFVVSRESVFYSCEKLPITFQSRVVSLAKQHILLKNVVPLELIGKFVSAKQFRLQIAMIVFTADHIDSDGVHLQYPLNHGSSVEEIRDHERHPILDDEQVHCEFINPFDAVTLIKKPLIEMSSGGFSLASKERSALFSPGMDLEAVKIFRGGKLEKQSHCQVVYNRELINEMGTIVSQVGVKFV